MQQQPHQSHHRIAIVVGEVSGDSLGAQLIRDFKAQGIAAQFVGIGGPQMQAEGFESLYPMESLSVMGLVEVFKHLKSLFAIRDGLLDYFKQHTIDLFIGIDAPDFNLRVARQIKLQQLPIQTVQYVSPSVWAWRQKRVFAIKKAVDVVLCLFPFEVEFYQTYGVQAFFVGHPLAQRLPLYQVSDDLQNQVTAKQQLGLQVHRHYLALLPGSRGGEIARLLPDMLAAAAQIHTARPEIEFIIPAINATRALQIEHILQQFLSQRPYRAFAIHIVQASDEQNAAGNIGRLAMQAAQAVLLASGTATLEAMLLHRPMVVVYRLHWLTYRIAAPMMKIAHYALPNIIAGQPVVTELIQQRMTPRAMAQAVLNIWQTPQGAAQRKQLAALHQQLVQPQHINAALVLIDYFNLGQSDVTVKSQLQVPNLQDR